MNLSFLGGAEEVGKSAVLLEGEDRSVVMDYGIKIGEEPGIPLPPQGFVDDIIVSHAHLDHSGAVPLLYKMSEPTCHMTPASLPLIELLINDSIKIRGLEGMEEIFTKHHLKRMLRNTIKTRYSEEQQIGPGYTLRFEDAGHILGASSFKLETPKANVVYTGDMKSEDTALHKGAYSGYSDVDVLITESTYGGNEHPPRKELEKQLYEGVQKTVDNGGIALIPAFAVGRSQEVITVLEERGFNGKIYLDGMSTDAADIMLSYPEYINKFNDFYNGMKNAEWIKNHGMRYDALKEPCAIVTTAGMLGGGPVVHYLLNLRNTKGEHSIFLTGYQAEGTPGRRIMESGRFQHDEYDLDFSDINIEFFDFSAHSDKHGLREFAKKMDPELIFVMHGEKENAEKLREWLNSNVSATTIVPKLNDTFDLKKYLK